jgi:hypothetical protein
MLNQEMTLLRLEQRNSATQTRHSVEVYRHPDEFPTDVIKLFSKSEQMNFQLGLPWMLNLVKTVYQDHDGVNIYVLRREGHPIAVLPILATKMTIGWQVQALVNYYTSFFEPVIETEADISPLIQAVLKAHAPVISLRFSPMNPASATYQHLKNALQANRLRPFDFFCFGNWYLEVSDDWSAYFKCRTGALRNTIKRMTKKFEAEGGAMDLQRDSLNLPEALEAYQKVYAASWKEAEPYPEFIPGLIRMCADQGTLRLGIARSNGQAIAAQLWVVVNKKAFIFKVAYDENFKSYAPGTLVTAMLMKHVLEHDQVTEVDFLTGDDSYKKNWMSHRRERWGIIAYNPKTLGGAAGFVKEVLGRILRTVIYMLRHFFEKKFPKRSGNSKSH